MKPTPYEVHNHIINGSGIKDLDDVIGFYNFNNGTIVQILEGRIKGETQMRYYARIGNQREFRECEPKLILTSSFGYVKDALNNPETLAEILGLKD